MSDEHNVIVDPASSNSPPSNEKTSVLLRRVLEQLPGVDIRIGYVVYQLRRRSFGGLLVLLAALNLLPGISFFSGLATIIPGLQMALGFRAPRLPWFIRRRRIDVTNLRQLGAKLVHVIEWLERFVKPRWLVLSMPPMLIAYGFLVIALAFVVILPLPLSNFPPSMALLLLSLGIMERDGMLIVIGLLCTAIALSIGILLSWFVWDSLQPLIVKHFF